MADALLLPVCLDRLLDANGDPLGGGKVYVYDAGTTDEKDVFTDDDLLVAAANPIIADSGGYVAARYIGTGSYKLLITTAADVTVKTEDNLPGALDTSSFDSDEATPVTEVVPKTGNHPVLTTEQGSVFTGNSTGGNITFTLPSAVTAGNDWRATFKHVGTANSVTVATVSSQTIDGKTSYVLNFQYESVTLVSDGANWHISDEARMIANSMGVPMLNGTLSASVAGNALTVAVKTLGGTDPSTTDPVFLQFRSSTLNSGLYVRRRLTSALSIVVPDTATLGTSSSTAFRLWVNLFDEAGDIRIGVFQPKSSTGIASLNDAALTSATLISTGADSAATHYADNAVTTVAMAIVGMLEWPSGLATAGTWSSGPTTVQLVTPHTPLPGTIVQTHQAVATALQSNVDETFTNVTGLSVALTLQSAASHVHLTGFVTIGAPSVAESGFIRLRRGTTAIGIGDAAGNRERVTSGTGAVDEHAIGVAAFDFLDTAAASATYTVQARSNDTTNTIEINGSDDSTDDANHPRSISVLTVQEIVS